MKTKILTQFGWGGSFRAITDNFARHGKAMVRHLTLRRAINLLVVFLEVTLRRRRVFSRPIAVKIEPTNVCNFRCPGCRTGSGEDKSPRGIMTLAEFKRIVDQTCRYAFKAILYMWGEPLINNDVFEMIRYAASKNLAVQISTNLNVFRDGCAEKLVESGLEHLIVALDGVSQEVYATYRVGGSVNKVVENLDAILRVKRQKNSQFPIVELQYIVFPHNRHEVPAAKQLANRLGVDVLTFIESDNGSCGMHTRKTSELPPDKCNALWFMACFNWDGKFSPCCDSVDDSFGNILNSGLDELWNSSKMQLSRSLQTKHPMKTQIQTKCARCRIYGRYVTFSPCLDHVSATTEASDGAAVNSNTVAR